MGNDEKFFLEYFSPIMDRNRTSDCVRRAFRIKSASPRSQIVLKKHFINETTATVAVEKWLEWEKGFSNGMRVCSAATSQTHCRNDYI